MLIRYQHIFITQALVGASAWDSQSEEPVPLPGSGHSSECRSHGVLSPAPPAL